MVALMLVLTAKWASSRHWGRSKLRLVRHHPPPQRRLASTRAAVVMASCPDHFPDQVGEQDARQAAI